MAKTPEDTQKVVKLWGNAHEALERLCELLAAEKAFKRHPAGLAAATLQFQFDVCENLLSVAGDDRRLEVDSLRRDVQHGEHDECRKRGTCEVPL